MGYFKKMANIIPTPIPLSKICDFNLEKKKMKSQSENLSKKEKLNTTIDDLIKTINNADNNTSCQDILDKNTHVKNTFGTYKIYVSKGGFFYNLFKKSSGTLEHNYLIRFYTIESTRTVTDAQVAQDLTNYENLKQTYAGLDISIPEDMFYRIYKLERNMSMIIIIDQVKILQEIVTVDFNLIKQFDIHQLFQSLQNIHKKDILIGDIKLENTMYDNNEKKTVFIDMDIPFDYKTYLKTGQTPFSFPNYILRTSIYDIYEKNEDITMCFKLFKLADCFALLVSYIYYNIKPEYSQTLRELLAEEYFYCIVEYLDIMRQLRRDNPIFNICHSGFQFFYYVLKTCDSDIYLDQKKNIQDGINILLENVYSLSWEAIEDQTKQEYRYKDDIVLKF